MYTTYTAELASHGYIVICPESNDGTAAETRLPDGTVLSYDTSCPRYTKQEGDGADRAFRQAQLSRRLRETALLVGHVDSLVADVSSGASHAATAASTAAASAAAAAASGTAATAASAGTGAAAATAGASVSGSATSSDFAGLRAVLPGASHIDASTVGLYGHSFGSCTVFELLQQSETAAGSSSSSSVIAAHRLCAAVCYDPWTMPLSAASRAHGTAVPLAVMTCTGFQYSTNEAREDTLVAAAAQRLQDNQRDSSKAQLVLQLEIDRAQHQNMSDSVLLAPEVARKIGAAGAADPVHMTDK
jgi:trimeric autotransporter adhesin